MKKKRLRAECNALCKAQDGPGPKWMSVCEQNLKGDSAEKGSPAQHEEEQGLDLGEPKLLKRCWRGDLIPGCLGANLLV